MTRNVAGILVLMAAAFAGTSASADVGPSGRTGPKNDCALRGYHVTSVRPYVREVNNGKRVVSRDLRGAEFYVEARPGISSEWLMMMLLDHIDRMGSGPLAACPAAVPGTEVDVTSSGPGFLVRLTAPDERRASEVLDLARTLE